MTNEYMLIEQLKKKISLLPVGYISEKNIKGKKQYYRQWKENGKLKSKYIRAEELLAVREQIEERKRLEEKLKELQKLYPDTNEVVCETSVTTGKELLEMTEYTSDFQKRDLYDRLESFIYSSDRTRVCAVYGLRRTGKTTMLLQAISNMSSEDFSKTAYIKLRTRDKIENINRDLKKLKQKGFKYIFIDEVTLLEDFIDSASLFSDIYALMGMKIVLSGTDSLGFWLARDNELYDRVKMIHTTYIPYREYSRLLGIDSIDEYIRYGGTLRAGEIDFDDETLNVEDASFYNDESTRRYIDTAISKNIQHSLECFRDGHYFSHLRELYEAGELTNAINRIVEDMNHKFLVSVIEKKFKSHDLGMSATNLRREKNPDKRTDILDLIDIEAVTKRQMQILDIRNKEGLTVPITKSHVILIKKYLEALDLILDCPIEHGEAGVEKEEHILFLQPGMRYCQAQALVHSLMKDDLINNLGASEKEYIANRILEEVRGRMLEDIILLETSVALGRKYKVFKFQCLGGEYDMLIYNVENDECAVYEIKHSREMVYEQTKHLRNEEMLDKVISRFGKLVGRFVLYLGKNNVLNNEIVYINAEEFLKSLPNIDIDSGFENFKSDHEI